MNVNTAHISLLIIIFVTFLVAGFVKGVIGLGLPTVAVGLLSLVMSPVQAAALLVIPSLVTNVWQLLVGPRFEPLLRRLWPMQLGICIGTWAGMGVLDEMATGWATSALGVVLLLYAGMGIAALRLPAPGRAEPWLAPLAGATTGLVTAATGVFVVPAVPFLQTLGLDKEELVQALGLSFTVSTIALAIGLTIEGSFQLSLAGTSLVGLVSAAIGMVCGQWVRKRVHAHVFQRWFFLGLIALGVHLVFQGMWEW